MRNEEPMTLNQLAKRYGVKPNTAKRAARVGYLRAQLIETPIGPVWMATERDFLAWMKNPALHKLFGNP